MADEALPQIPPQYLPVASRWPVTIKQLILVIGLAGTVAAAVAVILWSQSPSYTAIHPGMDDRDAAEVVAMLQSNGIPHRLDGASGAVMVPGGRKGEVRLLLAEAGLPRGTVGGMERLREGQNLGQTPFMENAFYVQAMQTELARTIMELRPVQGARVHLAVPPRSVFLRDRQSVSASVMLELFPGRVLDQAKVSAVVHLVASSVPELEPEQVTVVDQLGNLLTSSHGDNAGGISASQFEYTKRFEQLAAGAIESQLSPVLGASRVRATVAADLDFTVARETRKSFDPNNSVVISEEQEQQTQRGDLAGQGIPGAVTNQPPEAPVQADANENVGTISSSSRRRSNFDVDETFRETQLPTGTVRRLSVAVLIDNKAGTGRTPGEARTQEELAGLTELAKQAIGFDEARGDTISVLNSAFLPPAEVGSVQPPPLWEQAWVWDIVRQLMGVILVLLLALFVVKPIVKNLTKPEPPPMLPNMAGGGVSGMEVSHLPVVPHGYDDRMAAARTVISQDPRQVAQVMRNWVGDQNE
jgi:flagellar M-ring protein FliF